jgi:hypothetical protein
MLCRPNLRLQSEERSEQSRTPTSGSNMMARCLAQADNAVMLRTITHVWYLLLHVEMYPPLCQREAT